MKINTGYSKIVTDESLRETIHHEVKNIPSNTILRISGCLIFTA